MVFRSRKLYFPSMTAAVLAYPAFSFDVPFLSNRRSPFAWAIAASILLHGFALGWLPGLQKADQGLPEPLSVFMPPPPPEERPVVKPPPTPPPEPEISPRPRRVQQQAVPQVPLPVLTQAPGEAPADTPSIYAPVPVEPPPPVVEQVRAPIPPPRPVTPDPAALAAYGKSLAGAVAAQQKYPRLAMMRKWQGTTLLQLDLTADGQLREMRVISSSGHDILDQQALDMVRAALPLPPLPATLAERPLTIDVPVVFRLTP